MREKKVIRTVPIYFFILKVPGRGVRRTITVIYKLGTVLNIFLNPDGAKRAPLRERVFSAFPGAGEKADARVKGRLEDYFRQKKRGFDLKYDLSGLTPFQRKVLSETASIPHGKCLSYSELGRKLGNPGLARAVGSALAANPVPILIPCHRVVKADGSTGGFMSRKTDATGWKSFLIGLESDGTRLETGKVSRVPSRRSS